jgi:hypothetical protein
VANDEEIKDEEIKEKLIAMSDEISEDIDAIKRRKSKKETEEDKDRINRLEGKLKEIEESGEIPTIIKGKIYKDRYKIKRFGPEGYSSDYTTLEKYDNDTYIGDELLGMGDIPDKKRGWIRRAKLEVEFQCCYNNEPANDSIVIKIIIEEIFVNKEDTKGESLDEWIERRGMESIQRIGENECEDWAYNYEPCEGKNNIKRVIEKFEGYEIGEVPQDVIDRIERLEGLIADSMKAIEEYEDMIADILAKKEEDRTTEDREKLLRLDGYVRSERESIRKYQFEIDRLKKEWNIE